jgi:hypothetical protein
MVIVHACVSGVSTNTSSARSVKAIVAVTESNAAARAIARGSAKPAATNMSAARSVWAIAAAGVMSAVAVGEARWRRGRAGRARPPLRHHAKVARRHYSDRQCRDEKAGDDRVEQGRSRRKRAVEAACFWRRPAQAVARVTDCAVH